MKKQILLFVFILLASSIFAQQNQKRVALVIGNASYQHGGSLKNPVNDANLMASTLENLGFEVTKITNANLKEMQQASIKFTSEIKNYDVALFYYAGHGVQVNGVNYLVPTDANMDTELSTKYEALDISDINYAFSQNNSRMNIMILDACRDNPFRSWERGGDRGFKAVGNQSAGTIIAFATREGETASDGTGNNGLFTEKLVQEMQKNQDINSVFKNTRVQVLSTSKNKQCPQEWDMTTGSFYFTGKGKQQTPDPNESTWGNEEVVYTYGNIEIYTQFEGDFYLDGTYKGKLTANTRKTLNSVTTGSHSYKIQGTNETKTGNITIYKNQTASIEAKSTYVKPNDLPQNMALIKAGSFTMGSPSSEVDRSSSETQHTVKISYNFMMGKHEVTQAEYKALMGTNPSYNKNCDNCPVEKITWFDAIKYCNALSKKEGFAVAYNETTGELLDANGRVTTDITKVVGYRLPTEAEWEYSARAGTTTPFSTGSNLTTSQANYDGNYPYNGNSKGTYRKKTIAVESFSSNVWGLYDMHGNVYEWCHDWYVTYPNSSTNPIGANSGSRRVLRGGSWYNYASNCRVADRFYGRPTYSYNYRGFRIARSQ